MSNTRIEVHTEYQSSDVERLLERLRELVERHPAASVVLSTFADYLERVDPDSDTIECALGVFEFARRFPVFSIMIASVAGLTGEGHTWTDENKSEPN